MSTDKKWNLLFIKDSQSKFDATTNMFDIVFNKVDIVEGREDTLEKFDVNEYDIVLGDLSEVPEEVAFLKQLKDKKSEQTIFALIAPKDTDKLYAIADLGIHAFELLPEQFDLALEEIGRFNPYEQMV